MQKLVGKLAVMQEKTSQRFSMAEVELRDMEDEAAGYGQEREEGNAEIQRNQAQIEEMKALLKIKRAEIRDKDRLVGEIADQVSMRDSEIDRLQGILNEKDMEV